MTEAAWPVSYDAARRTMAEHREAREAERRASLDVEIAAERSRIDAEQAAGAVADAAVSARIAELRAEGLGWGEVAERLAGEEVTP
ncbi:hypothetical protein J4573_52910 [Actinomadura barringtoniae]|uniref:Uncharacterized protein n=1 Tax=Actinomadura barringtoniae TaxID=1427535 RepID=A0A939TGX1_9ACTN|nr:hypothetical protein [Actinomadura barringtoniae]MBO2455860.1 hypothetical protein [Actinomadura barringtoniae]